MREVGWAGQGWGAGVALVNVGLAGDRNGVRRPTLEFGGGPWRSRKFVWACARREDHDCSFCHNLWRRW